MAIKYNCSNGERVSEATIKKRLSESYRRRYEGIPHPRCEETGLPAQGSSHIISKKRCKELGNTELIWNEENYFPATHDVNLRWEANDTKLRNYERYMDIVKKYDKEGYERRINRTNNSGN